MRKIKIIIIAVLLTAIVGIITATQVAINCDKRDVVATVTDKDIKGEKGRYMVYTKENGETSVFVVRDTVFHRVWNASDTYAEIEVGKTYRFTIVGIRNRVFSMYPNVINIEEIVSGDTEKMDSENIN